MQGVRELFVFSTKFAKTIISRLEVEKSFLKEFFCLKTITVVFYENK